MLFLFLDKNRVRLLGFRKSMLGQFETNSFSKNYQSNLLTDGRVGNIDFIASAMKEALEAVSTNGKKDRDCFLILPQESYHFLRIQVPPDIASSAVDSFVKDKVKSNLPVPLENTASYYFIENTETEKVIHFFAIEHDVLKKFKEALSLIDLNYKGSLPETIAYFTLFNKTLRRDKKENIFFVLYETGFLTGFLYDSLGLLAPEKWEKTIDGSRPAEEIFKEKALEFEKEGKKLNRIILAGQASSDIRQDTFTKAVGVWTNPLKRIIPEFYAEYLKLLVTFQNKPFAFLSFEPCLGGFIFVEEKRSVPTFAKQGRGGAKISFPKISIPKREILIFTVSFILSFLSFILLSNFKSIVPPIVPLLSPTTKPQPALSPSKPKATPIPSPLFTKAELKIKVLNGTGIRGKASEVKDLLNKKGYLEILTDNADNFDYTESELQIKKSKNQAKSTLIKDLAENVSPFKESVLPETESADVVIIIGPDFK